MSCERESHELSENQLNYKGGGPGSCAESLVSRTQSSPITKESRESSGWQSIRKK